MQPRSRRDRIITIVAFGGAAALAGWLAFEHMDAPAPAPKPTGPVAEPPFMGSPVIGTWWEIARIPCDGGPEYMPLDPIQEFVLYASGDASATRRRFETYFDYHFKFEVDDATRALRMFDFSAGGAAIDGEGHYEIDEATGALVLRDIWLAPLEVEDPDEAVACGHRLVGGWGGGGGGHGKRDIERILPGRWDSSAAVRGDTFETLAVCEAPLVGRLNSYLRMERSVASSGTRTTPQVEFVHVVDRGLSEAELRIYPASHPDDWRGIDCGRQPFDYPDRGPKRCTVQLYLSTKSGEDVWAGASRAGDCKSEREGDAYMIMGVRIKESTVEIWERGFDEHGQQTWGRDQPTLYSRSMGEWPEPQPPPAERLLSQIAGTSHNAAPLDYIEVMPAHYQACPVEVVGHELPAEAASLLLVLTATPGTPRKESFETHSYLFVAYPQREQVVLDVVPFDTRRACEADGDRRVSANELAWEHTCTIVLTSEDGVTYTGQSAEDCPSHVARASRLQIEATIQDGAFDFWPRWYDDAGEQVRGPRSGPYQFRREQR